MPLVLDTSERTAKLQNSLFDEQPMLEISMISMDA